MRSLDWFRYSCIYRLLCITYKAIDRGIPEYLAKSIIIQSSNRSNRKCHVMKLMQCSTSLSYSESVFSVMENLEFTAI